MSKIFKKVNGRYVEIGQEFTGFPTNGLWLVKDGIQNCLIPMGDVPEFADSRLTSHLAMKDELTDLLTEKWQEKALSVNDIAGIACKFFAKKSIERDTKELLFQI